MGPFVLVLWGWTAVAHIAVALSAFVGARALGLPWPALIGAAVATALVLPFRGRMQLLMPDLPRRAWRIGLVEIPYFAHWCAASFALVWTVLAAIAWMVARVATGAAPFSVANAAAWGYAAGALIAAWGVWIRRKWVSVRRIDVPIADLDRAFDGYTIVHLSDLHIGSFNPRSTAMRWAQMANAVGADMIAVTGDLTTNGSAYHDVVTEMIGALRAGDGVVVSPGNHDYFGDAQALFDKLEEGGARVLRNQSFSLRRGGASLVVAGADDTWTRRADVGAALAKVAPGQPSVLLAHDPALFPIAIRMHAKLVLSGHTHGGQIAVPFLARWLNLSRLSHRYQLGLYRDGDAHLYVNGGLGTTGPPVRVGSPPEITVLRLVAASSGASRVLPMR